MPTAPSPDTVPDTVSDALARLNSALETLNQVVETTVAKSNKVANAHEEIQRMADDRSKLAQELDSAEAKALHLSDTNREVSRRLVGAMEVVRDVLNKQA